MKADDGAGQFTRTVFSGRDRGCVGITRRQLLWSLAGASAVALGGAAGLSDAADGELRLAFAADPAGFDPARGPSGMSHVIIEQVYSTLMALDVDANPRPDLAESVSVSSSGLEYSFRLRDHVKFHNGDPLDAKDVAFTFERLLAPESAYAYRSQVETIAEITVIDRLTVVFRLSAPTGSFLTHMAFPGSSIVPKRLVESGHDLNAAPVGSGPFRFVSYTPRSSVRLTRNSDFYETGKPRVSGLHIELIADGTALTNALLAGEVDFSNEIPPKDWAQVLTTPGLVSRALEGSRYYWLVPNNSRPPLNDARVRQAIAHAIDRQAIASAVFFDQAKPLLGGVIPEWSWAYPNLAFVRPSADTRKAQSLLAEAGYSDGFKITLTVASSFPPMLAMAPIVKANLEAVGIDATITTMEVPRYWDEVWGPSNFELTAMYWVSPLADPDDFVFNNYACGTPINVQKSCSPEMDALLQKAKRAHSTDERRVLYRKQQDLANAEMPIIPLVNAYVLTAHSTRLRGFEPMRTGFLRSLRDVRLD